MRDEITDLGSPHLHTPGGQRDHAQQPPSTDRRHRSRNRPRSGTGRSGDGVDIVRAGARACRRRGGRGLVHRRAQQGRRGQDAGQERGQQSRAGVRRQGGPLLHQRRARVLGDDVRADAKQLAADPSVAYVEQNQVVHGAPPRRRNPPSWGLDRIDQRACRSNNSYTYPNTGAGVTAYIIDTGILTTHPNFGGRAIHGCDIIDNDSNATDCQGHGTHVAGTVGGSDLRRGQGRQAGRGPGARLQRRRHHRRRHRGHRLGDRRPRRSSRPWPT